MLRKEIPHFRQYLDKKKKEKRREFRFEKEPTLPEYPTALTPRILRKKVLKQIEKSMNKISKEEELPWTGESLTTAIQNDLVELNALSKLTPRVFALEPQAVSEFRRWITKVKPFYGFSNDFKGRKKISNISKPQESICLENCTNDMRMFTELVFAALMTARSEKEWLDNQSRIDTLFIQNEIVTSMDRDLRNLIGRGMRDQFVDKMRFHGRERNWGDGKIGFCDFPPRDDLPPRGELPPIDGIEDPFRDNEDDIFDYCFTKDYTLDDIPYADFHEAATIYRTYCYSVLRGVAFFTIFEYRALFHHLPANSPYLISDIISSISPQHLCSGEILTIEGEGFGNQQQDSNLKLLLPFEVPGYGKVWRIAEVEEERIDDDLNIDWRNWTDTTIKLKCPDWARSGPIGFIDIQVFQDLDIFREYIGEILWAKEVPIERTEEGERFHDCGIQVRPAFWDVPVFVFPAPPLTSVNMFWGTIPEITWTFNGEEEIGLPLDGTVVIDWKVIGATSSPVESINIYRSVGLYNWQKIGISFGGNEVMGSLTITFNEIGDRDIYFRIEAENICGTVQKAKTVHLREPTEVTIYAIEVNQAIQTFNKDDPSKTNVIPLVEGKETVVRVYASSNRDSNLDNVSGELYIGPHILYSIPIDENEFLPPDDRVDSYEYGPSDVFPFLPQIKQDKPRPSLKFPLPNYLTIGTLELKVKLYSTDEWAAWEPVEFTTTVEFEEMSPLNIYLFKVQTKDNRTSDEEINVFLEKLRAIFPISFYDGINIVGEETLDISEEDFTFKRDYGWDNWNPIHTSFFDFFDNHLNKGDYDDKVIHCVIIPKDERDGEKGIAWPGPPSNLGGTCVPIAFWCAKPENNSYIEAHEIGHAMGLDHSSGAIKYRGVDTRFSYGTFNDCDIPTLHDLIMQTPSDGRWINAPEYLWVMFYINVDESHSQRLHLLLEFVEENDLKGKLKDLEYLRYI